MTRSIKRKLIRARIKLNQTLHQILEINRNRKKLPYQENALEVKEVMDERLKVLNKIAEQQAKLIQRYEILLNQDSSEAQQAFGNPV